MTNHLSICTGDLYGDYLAPVAEIAGLVQSMCGTSSNEHSQHSLRVEAFSPERRARGSRSPHCAHAQRGAVGGVISIGSGGSAGDVIFGHSRAVIVPVTWDASRRGAAVFARLESFAPALCTGRA